MKIRLADYVANFLVDKGVTDIFSVVGGGAMHLNDAFGHNDKLKVTYNHHEQASAICAEAYARLNNKIAGVCVTTGPGGTNALTGVLGGWLDSIPMFIISGQVKLSTTIKSTSVKLRQLGDQEFNIVDCVSSMTKYCVMITDAKTIKYHLEKAYYIAINGRPGPVWIDIPLNLQSSIIDTEELLDYDSNEDINQIVKSSNRELCEQLIEKIKNSSRPVILAGEGITISNTREEFIKFINNLNIPVVTAWNAHDLLADDNALYCGRPGTVGLRGGNIVLQQADFVLSLGCRMNIRQISYNYENFAKNAFLAAVDIDYSELIKPTLNVDMKIHDDLRNFFKNFENIKIEKEKFEKWVDRARTINLKYPANLLEYYKISKPVNPYVFMAEMSKQLSNNDVIVCGNGSACVCGFQGVTIKEGQRMFTNSGCASMGYGFPAALGVAVARNGERVICIDGDGSFMMNMQELQTVVGNKLPVKLFLLNNDGYHSIRQTQTNLFNSNFCGVDGNSGVTFPDFKKVAKAFKIKYFRISSVAQIKKVTSKVLNFNGPVFCEVMLDKNQFFAPKLSSKSLPDGTIVSPTLEDMYPFLPEQELREIMTIK